MAINLDVHTYRGGHEWAGGQRHGAGGKVAGKDVLAEHYVRRGDLVHKSVIHHGLGTGGNLLARLENELQGAGPLVSGLRHERAHAQQAGHVGIVAAGVHDGDRVSFLVNGAIGGGVFQAGVFLNR